MRYYSCRNDAAATPATVHAHRKRGKNNYEQRHGEWNGRERAGRHQLQRHVLGFFRQRRDSHLNRHTGYRFDICRLERHGLQPQRKRDCRPDLHGNLTPQPAQTPTTYILSVAKTGNGNGTVTSTPTGLNCGSTCSAAYASGTLVTLKATAATGSSFNGWSGSGCSGGVMTMNASNNCTATFQSTTVQLTTKFGVFRPDTGEWFLDRNGNGQWDGCTIDKCIGSFGQSGDLPVTGNWSGNGVTNVGTFTPSTGSWRLDTNGDGVLDCDVDTCGDSFGQAGDFPVTRELGDGNGSIVGIFTPQTLTTDQNQRKTIKRGGWNFGVNGNSTLDGCEVDECTTFRILGELPIVGDWNGTGTQDIGLFLPRKGSWHLDRNGNGKWDSCEKDKCFGPFGAEGDLPIIGDWDGTGTVRIGVFRPSTGMWYLDINGNGKMDSCTIDGCFGPFGQPGDLPVVGKW